MNIEQRSKRKLILQQMGISVWHLRRAILFTEEGKPILLPDTVRLILVSDPKPNLAMPLLQDILRTLKLTSDQVSLQSTPPIDLFLPDHCVYWVLGEKSRGRTAPTFFSPTLDSLQTDPAAKCQLWQQMGAYVGYFTTPSK